MKEKKAPDLKNTYARAKDILSWISLFKFMNLINSNLSV